MLSRRAKKEILNWIYRSRTVYVKDGGAYGTTNI